MKCPVVSREVLLSCFYVVNQQAVQNMQLKVVYSFWIYFEIIALDLFQAGGWRQHMPLQVVLVMNHL